MPLRTFRGEDGAEWRVWNVVPGRRQGTERRRGYDRRSPSPVLRHGGLERREGQDRRHTPGLVSPELRLGWLIFQREGERRRLAPVPPGWERLAETALARLCAAARSHAP
jgi:hypothetical protein